MVGMGMFVTMGMLMVVLVGMARAVIVHVIVLMLVLVFVFVVVLVLVITHGLLLVVVGSNCCASWPAWPSSFSAQEMGLAQRNDATVTG
jgi:hypothetical protein